MAETWILEGGCVLTVDRRGRVLRNGSVAVVAADPARFAALARIVG